MKTKFYLNIKKQIHKFLICGGFLSFLTLVSCSTNSASNSFAWDTKVNIGADSSWTRSKDPSDNRISTFLSNLSNEFNKLKNQNPQTKNLANVTFEFQDISDSRTAITQLLAADNSERSIDFAFADATSTIEIDKQNQLQNALQTTTWAFATDLEPKSYSDGSSNDYLVKQAQELSYLFNQTPFNQWQNTKNGPQKWDGVAYRFLYDKNKTQVPFYRGMIMIAGDSKTLKAIKKYWNDRDFEQWEKFGIIHGKESSGGRWKLEANLIQQHFANYFKNKQKTLSEEKIEKPQYFLQESPQSISIGQNQKFKIAFDDEASFAWTPNEGDGSRFTPKNPNEKIEILTLTNPLPYDIGSFRGDFNKLQRDLISQALINLSLNNKDTFGESVGYNGYQKISDSSIFRNMFKNSLEAN